MEFMQMTRIAMEEGILPETFWVSEGSDRKAEWFDLFTKEYFYISVSHRYPKKKYL